MHTSFELTTTLDVGLCDSFPPTIVPTLALNCTTGKRIEPYKPNPFPQDDYDRFLWYWYETVDLIAALAAADQDGKYVLFLEDDVIPTVRCF